MAILRREISFEVLGHEVLAAWRDVAASVVGDAQNRSCVMHAAIKPLGAGMRVVGQARTVAAMVGDNSAAHVALALARPGEVLVIDGGGHVDTAIWGEIMGICAVERRLAGVIIDGAVRDVERLRQLGLPIFARGVVPRGPHKGWGGTVDGPISAGGVSVRPGDVIVGDDDGVAVVPLASAAAVLEAIRRIEAREAAFVRELRQGRTSAELVGVMVPQVAD